MCVRKRERHRERERESEKERECLGWTPTHPGALPCDQTTSPNTRCCPARNVCAESLTHGHRLPWHAPLSSPAFYQRYKASALYKRYSACIHYSIHAVTLHSVTARNGADPDVPCASRLPCRRQTSRVGTSQSKSGTSVNFR